MFPSFPTCVMSSMEQRVARRCGAQVAGCAPSPLDYQAQQDPGPATCLLRTLSCQRWERRGRREIRLDRST